MIEQRALNDCCPAYSLVLMDMCMPVMDGIEAARAVGEAVKEGRIPEQNIAALTGEVISPEEEERLRAEVGFVAYFTKPLSKSRFVEIFRKFCGDKSLC